MLSFFAYDIIFAKTSGPAGKFERQRRLLYFVYFFRLETVVEWCFSQMKIDIVRRNVKEEIFYVGRLRYFVFHIIRANS